MKILITEPTYKHALAISHYLKAFDPSLQTIGVSSYQPRFPSLFAAHYDEIKVGAVEEILRCEPHDLLIPVGNASVELASSLSLATAVLPPKESLAIGLSKPKTLAFAEKLGIPIPKTLTLESLAGLSDFSLSFPCVVKGSMEAGKNVVTYPKDLKELFRDVEAAYRDPTQKLHYPIIQEYVCGTGLGFFGFYQQGKLKRFYMHQRIREFPLSGGASTAAKTIFHAKAFAYGKRLLDALQWHGPAMVEFKYDPETDALALMEINPKFWGSTELGLAAGVNFGELLLRVRRGEELKEDLSPDSYKKITFKWPFEGDLRAILQARDWKALIAYAKKKDLTNTKTNGFWLNSFRLLEGLKKR